MGLDGRIRLGFAGAGDFAREDMAPVAHACPNVVLQAVGTRDETRGRALEPQGRVHSSYEALVEDPDVDAIYVVLSNDLHLPVVELALRAGKHVLCEKPLGLSGDQVKRMHALAKECDLVLMESMWSRFHPRQIAAEHIVHSGDIGAVRSVDTGFSFDRAVDDNFRLDPAHGGGAFYDVGCYAMSFAVAMMSDREPVSAAIDDSVMHSTGVDLRAQATLTWDDGATATVTGGFTGPVGRWGSVSGSDGSLVLRDPAFSWWPEDSQGTRLEVFERDGRFSRGINFDPCHGRLLCMQAFAEVVAGRADPTSLPVTPEHSIAVAIGLDLVHRALGRSV